MSIQVLYFAAVRDLVGKDEESVDFVGTIAELSKALEQRHAALSQGASARCASRGTKSSRRATRFASMATSSP